MSTADIQINVVFGGQYSFEKLQSDWEQENALERDFIKNKPDLVNFEAETVTAETVIFNENPTNPVDALKMQYNPAEKTIEFGLADGGKLQIGKEMFEEYVNVDTVALTNGMIVSTAAIPGNRKGIKRTDFTSLTSIRSIVGMVTVASIGTNQSGRVTTKGIINDLNTNGIGEGSQLWGNPSVLGGWSGIKPAKPQYAVQIGQVVVAHATVGSVELNIAKDVKFSDLADVNGSTNLIDNTDTIPKRDADGIIREITVANVKEDFKADTDLIYEPLLGFTPEDVANKGQANGYASLGADGLVPSTQLPSFVDDVLEFTSLAAFPTTGESGKIYVALDTNKTYRWSGSVYVYITSGAVDSVAGKTGVVTLVKADVGLGNVDNTSDANKPISTATQIALGGKVSTTGDESIAGVKTFASSPVVPTPSTGGQAANKTYVDTVVVTQANVEQVRSQATNKVASSKLIDDELTALENAVAANNQTWVGVVIDPTLSSSEPAPKSTVTAYRATELMRTGNLYYHKFGNSRIFNAFQPAIVDRATRKVAWYLNKNNPALRADGTTSTPDWTTQNIAVIVPNLYRRITVLDVGTGKYEVAYDIAPFDGAQLWHEESAHSPGFASVDRTLTQLVSVVSDDVRFRGGNNNGAADGLPSTQLGRPATAISRINFENYAAAAGWETGNIADRTMWHELTALYFANTNIQLDYTTTLTAEGYPQGGLGAGVTAWNISRWNYRNGYYPIHKVGEGFMTIGCNTGVKSMTDEKYYVGAISSVSAGNLVATGHFTSGAGWSASYIGYTVQNLQTLAEATITGKTDDNTLTLSDDIFQTAGQWYWIKGVTYSYQIPVFFGLEHLYGEIWDWVSGVNVEVSATVENGGTGESKAYVCTDFSKRAATITPDYTYIGITPRVDGYIKELYRDFAIAKVNTGAGSATFMSDNGYYGNLPSSESVVMALLFGASARNGGGAGVRTSAASRVPPATLALIGARLRAKIEK